MLFNVRKLYDKADGVLLGDFGDIENKILVEKKLFGEIKDKPGKWAARSYNVPLPAPYKTATFRVRVQSKAKDSSQYVLAEGIKPEPNGKLLYKEYTKSVRPYGVYQNYTDEDMTYGFDAIVDDLVTTIQDNGKEIVNDIAAKAWFGGNNVITLGAALTREAIIRARINLGKFAGSDKQVHCVITPEDLADLRLKYNTGAANLFVELPTNAESVIYGTLTRFENVIFEEDDSEYMYGDGVRYALFYCKDKRGNNPVAMIAPFGENGEFICKALGSSGALDDPLNQNGSVGIKWKGLGSLLTSEETLIRMVITPATDGISGTNNKLDTHYDFDNGKIYVEGKEVAEEALKGKAGSPKSIYLMGATEVAVKGTITLKVIDELGEAVTGATLTSLDTGIATVAGYAVTGVKVGTVVVKATKDGYTSVMSIEVKAA